MLIGKWYTMRKMSIPLFRLNIISQAAMTSELRDQLFSGGFLIGCVIPPYLHGRVSPLPKRASLPWVNVDKLKALA